MNITDIQPETLEKIKAIFGKVSAECFELFFPNITITKNPWNVVKQLKGHFDYILTMSSANEIYKTVLTAGASRQSLVYLMEQDRFEKEEVIDVLGEFVNTYCAMLNDEKVFLNQFGILIQSLPVLYTNGQSLLTFIWGVEGKIYIGGDDCWLYLGYAIQKQ